MSGARAIFTAVVLTSVAACSIFGNFSEFSSEDPSASNDASTDATANGGGDASAIDAGTGGGQDSSATGEPYCATSLHAFCADFEYLNALDAFTGDQVAPNGTLALSTTRAKGGVRSLFASLPRRATEETTALLSKTIPGDWRRTVVEFDMYLEPPDWQTNDVNASIFEIAYASDTQSVTFYAVTGKDYFNLGGGGATDTYGPPIATGKWIHFKAELTTSALQVSIDGAPHATHAFTALTASGVDRQIEMAIGVDGFNAPAPELKIYYDNLTVDFP